MQHVLSFNDLPRLYGITIVMSHTCLLKPAQGVYNLLTNGHISPRNLIMAGQYKYSHEELIFLDKNRIKHIPMHTITKKLPSCDTLIIDVSVLDYSVLRENSHGGLQLRELQQLIPGYEHAFIVGPKPAYDKIIGYLKA